MEWLNIIKLWGENNIMSKNMRHKIIKLIGDKIFKDRKELRKYLKKELGLPTRFTPGQIELEVAMDECEGAGFIEQVSYYRLSENGKKLIGEVMDK